MISLPFAKMNGAGNSILVVDERGRPHAMTGDAARRIGEGRLDFDQMMVIGDATRAGVDAEVRIFNRDGSRAGACGNGTRCVAWMMLEGATREDLALDIEGTEVSCRRDAEARFTVDMGAPGFDWRALPLGHAVDPDAADLGAVLPELGLPRPSVLGMGNPHAVFFVPDARAIDLEGYGGRLEHDAMFPDRANISFAEVASRDHIRLRTWERGAGATLACGSAACATLVAAARRGLTGRRATVSQRGGDLVITWRADDHVLMTGPVELEERGLLDLADLAA
ncbi:MAG TPA: diaminopimelate epimerase [Lichenihabitans sp.]|jgi:diaminopimelate epimerase|nr:diaminopimelate epimerase [Lichenihabitans sp.]